MSTSSLITAAVGAGAFLRAPRGTKRHSGSATRHKAPPRRKRHPSPVALSGPPYVALSAQKAPHREAQSATREAPRGTKRHLVESAIHKMSHIDTKVKASCIPSDRPLQKNSVAPSTQPLLTNERAGPGPLERYARCGTEPSGLERVGVSWVLNL